MSVLALVNPIANVGALWGAGYTMFKHRGLVSAMTGRELTDRYAGQVLGAAWAFIAPVSRIVRAAYMAAMFDTFSGISNICRTDAAAAVQSMSRLDMALASERGAAFMRAQAPERPHCRDTYSGPIIERLQNLGMPVN